MAYRLIEKKDGQIVRVSGGERRRAAKASMLNVGVFGQSAGGWPMHCDATGVNPDQISEAMAADAARGVSVPYDSHTGAAIYSGPDVRKRHCESQGFADRNGGYGDPQVGGVLKYE